MRTACSVSTDPIAESRPRIPMAPLVTETGAARTTPPRPPGCSRPDAPGRARVGACNVGSSSVWRGSRSESARSLGGVAAAQHDALGTFQHEAVALDPKRHQLYLTEDVPDGRFYRFTPRRWRRLEAGGVLEVAAVAGDGSVTWLPVPEPNPTDVAINPTRHQVPGSTAFRGGEGITYNRQ